MHSPKLADPKAKSNDSPQVESCEGKEKGQAESGEANLRRAGKLDPLRERWSQGTILPADAFVDKYFRQVMRTSNDAVVYAAHQESREENNPAHGPVSDCQT